MSYNEEICAQVMSHFNEAKRARDIARQESRDHQEVLAEIAATMQSLGMEVPDMSESFPVDHVYGPDHATGLGDDAIDSGAHPPQ